MTFLSCLELSIFIRENDLHNLKSTVDFFEIQIYFAEIL